MRYLPIILLILVGALPAYSQDVWFKVITCSAGVTINGKAAKPGMDVIERIDAVRIPEYGYCAIITHEGLVDVLTETMRVADVPAFARKPEFHRLHQRTLRLAFPFNSGKTVPVLTDSLFLYWGTQETEGSKLIHAPTSERYVMTFYNGIEEEVYSKKSTSNWIILPTSTVLMTDTVMLYSVRSYSPDMKSEFARMKSVDKKLASFIRTHIAELPEKDRLFYECAFYNSLKMYVDQQWVIYKLLKSGKTTNDPIFKSYMSNLRREFGLAHVDLK